MKSKTIPMALSTIALIGGVVNGIAYLIERYPPYRAMGKEFTCEHASTHERNHLTLSYAADMGAKEFYKANCRVIKK